MRRIVLALAALLFAGCSRTVVVDEAAAAYRGGAPALERVRSLAKSVETVARATANKGRQWAVERRAEELGLAKLVRVEWVDWWTPQKNVIIEVPAARASTGTAIVYVIAHYDKIDIRPEVAISRIFLDVLEPLLSWSYMSAGAVDNGTGVAVVLELAREVALNPRRDMFRFVLFGSEESGLRGSRCYVAGLEPEEVERVRLVVNVDSVGIEGEPNGIVSDDRADPLALASAVRIARKHGFLLEEWSLPRWLASSDDDPFWATHWAIDLLRGLSFNLGGALLPQRSWFTGLKHMPTVSFASPGCFDWTDVAAGLIALPIGTIHGPRDRCSRVDAWGLYEQYEIIRELTE